MVKIPHVESESPDLITPECNVGNLSLQYIDGFYYGNININNRSYIITSLDKQNQVLAEYMQEVLSDNSSACGITENELRIPDTDDDEDNDKGCEYYKNQIKVLVFYTQSAVAYNNNIESLWIRSIADDAVTGSVQQTRKVQLLDYDPNFNLLRRANPDNKNAARLYPNVVESTAVLNIHSANEEKIHVVIQNSLRKEVFNVPYVLNKGENSVYLPDLSRCGKGSYVLQIQAVSAFPSIKFIKQ